MDENEREEIRMGGSISIGGWSWEENKMFEVALAEVDEREPYRWEVVAAMVGGNKTADDVYKLYVILLRDLQFIESGEFDHKLGQTLPALQLHPAAQSTTTTTTTCCCPDL